MHFLTHIYNIFLNISCTSCRLFYILIIIYCINKIKSINHLLYKLDFRVRSILLCTMVFRMIRNCILYFRSFFDEQTLHFFENFFSLFPIIAFSIFNSSPKNIKTLTYLVIRTQCTLKILPYFLQNACFHKFIRSTIAKFDSIVLNARCFHSARRDRFNFISDHSTDITNYNTLLPSSFKHSKRFWYG